LPLKVVVLVSVVALVLNPRAIEMALTVLVALVVVGVLLGARAVWRTLRRPIGSLTVLDLALGSLLLRWWRHSRSH
jgi:energy-coupling factor transporter transmembrane protein EcfT